MTISGEDLSRVTNLLKLRPRGMSIAAIAKELHLNRNSVAKYLDLLTASGAVELTRVGPAKLYFTAPRVPVSGMINLSSDYFIMLDASLRVLYVNNHVLEFEERIRPEVLQKKLDDLSFTLVADDAISAYLHSTERDEMFQREVEVRKGEETFHFRVKIISTVYENGTQGITILATDITTEKEQEKALRASEAEYRGVVEDQSELIFRFRPDRIFTFANDAFLRVIGKRREEVVGVPATFPVLEEDMVKIRKAYGSLTMDHPTTSLEHRMNQADGSIRWMQVNFRAFFDEHGNPWEYQAVARDITDLKTAEEAISESEARYRAVVESQQEGILRFNPDGRFTFANDAFCRFVGRRPKEVLGSDITQLIPDIDIGRIREIYRSLTPDHPSTILEFRANRLDGETRWIQADFRGFFDDRGVPLEYQAVARDVTDLKAAERAIQESEARYRAVVEEQLEVVFRFRPDGIFTFANDAYCRFLGRNREEIVGSHLIFPLSDEDVGRIRGAYRSLTPSHPIITVEHRATRSDGESRWMQATIRALFDNQGKPQEYQIVARDVTDLKVAERAIQESEARYRAVVEDQEEGIARFKPDGKFTFANEFFCRFVGRPREQIIGSDVTHILPDLYLARIREVYRSLTPEQASTTLEFQAKRFDGTMRWIQASFRGLFDDRGRPKEYQVVARDVTDLKAAERRIQESEARYRAVVEDQTEWIVRFRPDGIFTFANDAFCRHLGKSREEVVGVAFTLPLSDEEYALTRKAYRSLTPEHSSTSLEVRVTMPDGTIRFMEVTFRALFDERGDPREYQAVGRDVTDRKKAEDLARAQFQSFPIPTYIVRRRGNELIASDYNEAAFLETRGLVARLIGRPFRDLFGDYPSILANLERCLAEKTTIEQEIRYKYLGTDNERDLMIRYAYLPPDGVLVYGTDITDRKRAEMQLQERVRELQVLYDISRLIERGGKDLPTLLRSIVQLLPAATRYPELTAARILYQGKEYATGNYEATPWDIQREIHVNGVPAGAVEIRYLAHPPVAGEEVFLPEEEALVGVVAERVGRIAERLNAESAVRDHIHLVTELLDRIPIPVFTIDTGGTYIGVNRAFEDRAGLPRTRILGHTAAEIWPSDVSEQRDAIIQQILKTGEVRRDERVISVKGQEPWQAMIHRAPFYGEDGAMKGIVGTIQDITDIRKAERALRAGEEQFREMAETSPFPIAILDASGRYRYLNRKFTDIFGYTLDDVPHGRQWFDMAFPDPDQRHRAIAAWKDDLSRSHPGEIRPRQFPVRCRNGECREVIFRPVTLRDGTQYITYEDVTERLTTLSSLRQSEARYRQLFNSMRCCFTLVEPVVDEKGTPVDLTFLDVNAAMERLSGRIREELVGQHLGDVLPGTPPELIRAIGAVALTGNPKKLAVYHPGLDRNLKIRAYSPWKGQCALIFKVVAPAGDDAGGKIPPAGNTS